MTTSINGAGRITHLNLNIAGHMVSASINTTDKRTIKKNKIRYGRTYYAVSELPNRTAVYIAHTQDGRLIAVNQTITKWEVLSEVSPAAAGLKSEVSQ